MELKNNVENLIKRFDSGEKLYNIAKYEKVRTPFGRVGETRWRNMCYAPVAN